MYGIISRNSNTINATLLGDQATVPVTKMTAHGEFIIYVSWYSYFGE